MKQIGCLVTAVLGISALAFPYLLTAWSKSSICFAGGPHVVSGEEKVSAVLDYLVRLRTLTTAERARIDPAACCRVDKGGGEATPLDLEAFLVAGMSHYVHVPAVLIPRYDRTVSNVGVREGLFVVNSCSDILARG